MTSPTASGRRLVSRVTAEVAHVSHYEYYKVYIATQVFIFCYVVLKLNFQKPTSVFSICPLLNQQVLRRACANEQVTTCTYL